MPRPQITPILWAAAQGSGRPRRNPGIWGWVWPSFDGEEIWELSGPRSTHLRQELAEDAFWISVISEYNLETKAWAISGPILVLLYSHKDSWSKINCWFNLCTSMYAVASRRGTDFLPLIMSPVTLMLAWEMKFLEENLPVFKVFIVLKVYGLEDVAQLVECLSIMCSNGSKE